MSDEYPDVDQNPSIRETSESFLDLMPEHKCGLYLSHNQHLGFYANIADYIRPRKWVVWKDNESKQRVIDTGEIWELQWYPKTLEAFYCVAAPTLPELLELSAAVKT